MFRNYQNSGAGLFKKAKCTSLDELVASILAQNKEAFHQLVGYFEGNRLHISDFSTISEYIKRYKDKGGTITPELQTLEACLDFYCYKTLPDTATLLSVPMEQNFALAHYLYWLWYRRDFVEKAQSSLFHAVSLNNILAIKTVARLLQPSEPNKALEVLNKGLCVTDHVDFRIAKAWILMGENKPNMHVVKWLLTEGSARDNMKAKIALAEMLFRVGQFCEAESLLLTIPVNSEATNSNRLEVVDTDRILMIKTLIELRIPGKKDQALSMASIIQGARLDPDRLKILVKYALQYDVLREDAIAILLRANYIDDALDICEVDDRLLEYAARSFNDALSFLSFPGLAHPLRFLLSFTIAHQLFPSRTEVYYMHYGAFLMLYDSHNNSPNYLYRLLNVNLSIVQMQYHQTLLTWLNDYVLPHINITAIEELESAGALIQRIETVINSLVYLEPNQQRCQVYLKQLEQAKTVDELQSVRENLPLPSSSENLWTIPIYQRWIEKLKNLAVEQLLMDTVVNPDSYMQGP